MKLLKRLLILGLLLALSLIIPNAIIINTAEGKTFNNTNNIPKNKVGLVLGAGKFTANGRINLYYKYRVEATVKLYKAGKIEFVLVSGDNSRTEYDEPSTFKEDLMKKGIPEYKIFLDYAGFRTLDSMVRAKEIFGQNSLTVISQLFHNERAIYLGKKKGINAIGFNAKDISGRYGTRTKLREFLARTKAFIDVTTNKKPKFLGKKIEIK